MQESFRSAVTRWPTSFLTQVLEDAVSTHQPPLVNGRRIKLRYAHLGGANPPLIVIHGNQVDAVPRAYSRYLENTYRRVLKLVGTPIRIEFKGGDNPYEGNKNTLSTSPGEQEAPVDEPPQEGREEAQGQAPSELRGREIFCWQMRAPGTALPLCACPAPRRPSAILAACAQQAQEVAMIVSKLPKVGTTIFTTMSQLAAECGALNLSQGFPDFDGPQTLREAVCRHVMAGHNQYCADDRPAGAARAGGGEDRARCYGRRLDADARGDHHPRRHRGDLLRGAGADRSPGDEVIVFDPCYDSYEPAVQLAGGRCVHVPLSLPNFAIDWERLEAAINSRTRLIILNSSAQSQRRADLPRRAGPAGRR